MNQINQKNKPDRSDRPGLWPCYTYHMASLSPSNPTAHTDPLRHTMLEVHQKLLSLYSALIMAEQLTYERIHGRVASTDELIRLVLNDPWFTWLTPLLDLLLRIDQLLDDDAFDITLENVEHLVAEVRTLTRPSIEGDGFERAYYDASGTSHSATYLVHLIDLVCFVYLVDLVHLVRSVNQKTRQTR